MKFAVVLALALFSLSAHARDYNELCKVQVENVERALEQEGSYGLPYYIKLVGQYCKVDTSACENSELGDDYWREKARCALSLL